MECVICGGKTKVINTRRTEDGRQYRRRKCTDCEERFTTYEVNQMSLFNMLEDYLPIRLIDEISQGLATGFPEQSKNLDLIE